MYARVSVVLCGLGLLVFAGCLSPVQQQTDALVCHSARIPIDPLPSSPPPPVPPVEELPGPKAKQQTNAAAPMPDLQQVGAVLPQQPEPLSGKDREEILKKQAEVLAKRLAVPPGVPGSEAPGIVLPENFRKLPPEQQDKILRRYFPPILPVGPDPQPMPGPEGKPLTLQDLQRLARENSPLLRQAASDIKAAEGAAWEAGMYPNPIFNLTSNMIGPNGGPLYGPGISQTIKTGGKLKLTQNMALMDLANAHAAYRRAETDLMASVRSGYYAVLVAEASFKANHALVDLTDEVYKIMLQQLKLGGMVAAYEPMQVSVYSGQARQALIASRTSYLFAWKQLGAALGLPGMPATELAGSIDRPLLRFDYEKCLARVLARHTDVITADNGIQKMRYNLRLNEVTWVPDVTLGGTLIYDNTPPGPPRWLTFFSGSMTIPVWDRNQGGIKQAQGQLVRAIEEPHRVRAALTQTVSDAFNRLETSRTQLEMFIRQMLPHQVNAFRSTVLRHIYSTDIAFYDMLGAEQNLVSLIPMYLTTLGAYWQAVSDIASVLQTDNVYDMATEVEDCPMPDLGKLLKLPCCHPCSELPNPALKGPSSFETPPGRPISPEIPGIELAPSKGPATPATPDAPKTPAVPKQSGPTALNGPTGPPAPAIVQPPQMPALLLPPLAVPAARD